MADLKDAMAYFISHYPENKGDDLSNARLTKLIYLADWHSCLRDKGQISNISWYFDNYGPFVWDIEQTAKNNLDIFSIVEKRNPLGAPKKVFKLKKAYDASISKSEKKSFDHILEVTKDLYWKDFIRLVYSTHPIASSERYEKLDLLLKAKEYKIQRNSI